MRPPLLIIYRSGPILNRRIPIPNRRAKSGAPSIPSHGNPGGHFRRQVFRLVAACQAGLLATWLLALRSNDQVWLRQNCDSRQRDCAGFAPASLIRPTIHGQNYAFLLARQSIFGVINGRSVDFRSFFAAKSVDNKIFVLLLHAEKTIALPTGGLTLQRAIKNKPSITLL